MSQRIPIPGPFSDWWTEALPRTDLTVALRWRNVPLTVGTFHGSTGLLTFHPEPADFSVGAERPGRMLAKALTRAGWRRPRLDPSALIRLHELRASTARVEFILDTNALVEGVGHWLVDHFADRCDLTITAVSLRELQDLHGRAEFAKAIPTRSEQRPKVLGPRQAYLAAHRLRERPGYPRVIWRELELDDAALLLSRGSGGDKTSESDTLLLRAVRRSIHARVSNLERFFVTGDTALARRATTELPAESVIAAQTHPIEPGEILHPCAWWPGPDQGLRITRHPARIVWELLCVGDEVALVAGDREWTFRAFQNPMWPSDYLAPWVDVTEPEAPVPSPDPTPEATLIVGTPWRAAPVYDAPLEKNYRIPGSVLLDLLAAIACASGETFEVPERVRQSSATPGHLRGLLADLDLAMLDGTSGTLLQGARALREVWEADDLDGLFDILRRWKPLDALATEDNPEVGTQSSMRIARAMAGLLGQGMYLDTVWRPGGRRPSSQEMRTAVLASVEPGGTITTRHLLEHVFLQQLGVSPMRVARAWPTLWDQGVFHGFEAREGGTTGGERYQEHATLRAGGWETTRFDLASVAGVRDLVFRGEP